MSKPRIITLAIAAIVLLILVFQNTASVDTRILFVTVSMPRALLLVVTAGIGFVAGLLVAAKGRGKKVADDFD